jgi:prephenate dehydrogenase
MAVHGMPPELHDRFLAQVSHLPHLVAAALVRVTSDRVEPFVGPGWTDTTRIAGGDPALWRDILMSNAAEVADAVDKFQGVLGEFASALRRGDAARIESLLAEAKARRDKRVRHKPVSPSAAADAL